MPKIQARKCQCYKCYNAVIPETSFCRKHFKMFSQPEVEEVDEPSRIDLEEAVMIAADELGFEDLEYLIDLPTDTTEWLRETMDGMNDDDLIALHKEIEDYKKKKATKLLRQRNRRIKAITDAIFFAHGGVLSREDALEYATTLARKLKL